LGSLFKLKMRNRAARRKAAFITPQHSAAQFAPVSPVASRKSECFALQPATEPVGCEGDCGPGHQGFHTARLEAPAKPKRETETMNRETRGCPE
jgi:hypothetical protein